MHNDSQKQFTGKYENTGRIGDWLINRFFSRARALLEPCISHNARLLEVGCGPGYSTKRIRQWETAGHLIAGDPELDLLSYSRNLNPETNLIGESVYHLPHPDKSFNAVIMLEVLEHLENPSQALSELQRVAVDYVLLSTPREPIWRILNMARGKYLGQFGNTPGHIQHWSARGLKRQAETWFTIVDYATPLPWTILLLRPKS